MPRSSSAEHGQSISILSIQRRGFDGKWEAGRLLVPCDLDAALPRGKGGRNFHKCFVRQAADFYCEELRPD